MKRSRLKTASLQLLWVFFFSGSFAFWYISINNLILGLCTWMLQGWEARTSYRCAGVWRAAPPPMTSDPFHRESGSDAHLRGRRREKRWYFQEVLFFSPSLKSLLGIKEWIKGNAGDFQSENKTERVVSHPDWTQISSGQTVAFVFIWICLFIIKWS